MEKKYNTTLIIGNGFDLSLGMNTSYKEFFLWLESSLFFEKNKDNSLISYIYKRGKQENWYDFENIIKEYALYEPVSLMLRRGRELLSVVDDFRKCKSTGFERLPQYADVRKISPSLSLLLAKIKMKPLVDSELVVSASAECKQVIDQINEYSNKCRKECLNAITLLTEALENFLRRTSPKMEYSAALTLVGSVLGLETKGFIPMAESCVKRFAEPIDPIVFPKSMIVSFNYTDSIQSIARVIQMRSGTAIELNHNQLCDNFYRIHGRLGDTIAFGTDNDRDIPQELWGLRKSTMIEDYAKQRFDHILRDSKRIVIFGHSLFGIDFEYYADFFSKEHPDTEIYIVCHSNQAMSEIQKGLENRNVSPKIKYRFTEGAEFDELCHEIFADENDSIADYFLAIK